MFPRALQQQDQRRDAAALAAAGESGARRARSPRPSATAGSPISVNCASSKPLADDAAFRDAFRKAKREAKIAVRRLAQSDLRTDRRSRTPSSTARSSAFTNTSGNCSMPCASSCSTTGCANNPNLEVPPRTFFFAGKAAPAYHLAKLIIKFINNLARHDRRRPGGARPAQGRVPAGLLRLPGRAADPRQRRFESDLDRRLRSQRHQQHEIHDERSADDRHPRRRDDRNGRGGRRGEFLPVRPDGGTGGRQPRLVQPALALRQRAGDPRRAGSDLLRLISAATSPASSLRFASAADDTATTTCTWRISDPIWRRIRGSASCMRTRTDGRARRS